MNKKYIFVGIGIVILGLILAINIPSTALTEKENNDESESFDFLADIDDDEHGKEVLDIFVSIDKDVESHVETHVENNEEDHTTTKNEIIEKHKDRLNTVVSIISKEMNYLFSDEEKARLIDMMVEKKLHAIDYLKLTQYEIPKDAVTETVKLGASAAQNNFEFSEEFVAGNPYPITSWKQVMIDVAGGDGMDSSGNDYDIEGGNTLSSVTVSYTPDKTIYTLIFDDEDHPDKAMDIFWDHWRQVQYGRTADIESFYITSKGIHFDGIWKNESTFADFLGQHGSKIRPYVRDSSIYISNTWNHSLDTINSNSEMSMITWTTT